MSEARTNAKRLRDDRRDAIVRVVCITPPYLLTPQLRELRLEYMEANAKFASLQAIQNEEGCK